MSFKKILRDIGCNVDADEERITLDQNPVLFHRELKAKMIHETVAAQFFESMKVYVEGETQFRKCLLPVQFESHSTSTFGFFSNSETLFRMILDFDDIQPQVIEYLLERIPEYYDDFESDESNATARLILHQLQFLENVVNPGDLAKNLLEVIESVQRTAQAELITSIPYILSHSDFNLAVDFLKGLMNEHSSLMLPILDTLPRLSKDSSSVDDIRDVVLDKLSTADLESLPLMVKYILETATPQTIEVIIFKMRERLDFRDLEVAQRQLPETNVPLALILEPIKYCLVSKNFIADAWVKTIAALEDQAEHKVLDMMVCFLLYWANPSNKKVERLIRKKITEGCISADLVQETIMNHVKSLSSLWSSILSLAHILLRSTARNPAMEVWCSTVYICSFKSCNSLQKRDIIDYLITHIGSHVASEMNTALKVLLQLAKEDVSSVAAFNSFLKDTLYHIDSLDSKQVGWLFDTFSLLALTTGRQDDGSLSLWDEIQNTIRKQLSSVYKKYKTVGVIATLSAVKVLGSRELCQAEITVGSSSSQRVGSRVLSSANHPLLSQAVGLMELAIRNISEYPTCAALLFDELSHIILAGILDQRLISWIQEHFTSSFTSRYLGDVEEIGAYIDQVEGNDSSLKPAVQLNLDGEESPVALTFYQIIYGKDLIFKRQVMAPMCSVFNLLQSCEQVLNEGSLGNIDALLGSGVVLFSFGELEELPEDIGQQELEDACDMLFYSINWLRELINAFSTVKLDSDLEAKLPLRLRNILELEDMLAEFLKRTKNYEPLEFQLSSMVLLKGSQHPTTSQKSNLFKSIDVTGLRTYMRALNMEALEMLNYEIQSENEDALSYKEINYLLTDLNDKIDTKIAQTTSNQKKKSSPEEELLVGNAILLSRMDTRGFMKQVIQHLPSIFKTLESTYQEIETECTQGSHLTKQNKDIADGMHIIFNILLKLLSWSDMQDHTNVDLLKEIINSLAERIDEAERRLTFQQQLERAAKYLVNYSTYVPQFSTATVLFKILLQLISFAKDDSVLKKHAVKVVDRIISTAWVDWREHKKEVPFLLEQSIKLNRDPLGVIENLVGQVLPAYEQDGALEDHPFLVEETKPQHCQAIILQITESLDILTVDDDQDLLLVQNARIVKSFGTITEYIKEKDQRELYAVLLRSGRIYIDHFIKHSIPYFTKVFRGNMEAIVNIFKDFQSSTRSLQAICSHVKALKDLKLSTFVPPLKKALENVIYQVKMLLVKNNVPAEAFFLGALKHRDIRGAEISSQIPREPESEDSEEEEEEEDELNPKDSRASSQCASPLKPTRKKKKTARSSIGKKRKQSSTRQAQNYRTSSVINSEEDEIDEDANQGEGEGSEEEAIEFDMNMSSEDEGGSKDQEEEDAASVSEVKLEPGSSPEPSDSEREEYRTTDEEEERVPVSKKKRRLNRRD